MGKHFGRTVNACTSISAIVDNTILALKAEKLVDQTIPKS
jgi:hypothetical protein